MAKDCTDEIDEPGKVYVAFRKVNGEALEYRVFVTTWLGFGANEARRRYVYRLPLHTGYLSESPILTV